MRLCRTQASLLRRTIFEETLPEDLTIEREQFRRRFAGKFDRYSIEKRIKSRPCGTQEGAKASQAAIAGPAFWDTLSRSLPSVFRLGDGHAFRSDGRCLTAHLAFWRFATTAMSRRQASAALRGAAHGLEERLVANELSLQGVPEEVQMDSEDAFAKVKEASEGVRETARNVRQSLEEGQPPGQALAFLRDVVREAPLPSLLVAFMLGYLMARR